MAGWSLRWLRGLVSLALTLNLSLAFNAQLAVLDGDATGISTAMFMTKMSLTLPPLTIITLTPTVALTLVVKRTLIRPSPRNPAA